MPMRRWLTLGALGLAALAGASLWRSFSQERAAIVETLVAGSQVMTLSHGRIEYA